MKSIIEECGQNAGKIWEALDEYGPLIEPKLMKYTRLTQSGFYAAVGWLARKNKICKDGAVYELGETNLAGKIGGDAGKLWKTLETWGEVDISSIAKLTRIEEKDAYWALGWLAREDKLMAKKGKTKRFINSLSPIFISCRGKKYPR